MTILASTPSSTASTSIVALSVSISARTSPALTVSPSLLTQRAILPSVIVGESAGISTSLVIPFLGVIGESAPARGVLGPSFRPPPTHPSTARSDPAPGNPAQTAQPRRRCHAHVFRSASIRLHRLDARRSIAGANG